MGTRAAADLSFGRLAHTERESLLDLLDLWPVDAPWRSRDFFARYVETDPRFRDEDVWVARRAGRLVGCVQIFPRTIRIEGARVAIGGIGSVFTHPDERGAGIASDLMRRVERDLAARGMPLGLLFAGPVPFYEALGWWSWPVRRPLLRPAAASADPSPPAEVSLQAFDPVRDLAEVDAIHAEYSRERRGTLVRDRAGWEASLRVAGNPREEFRVARAGEEVIAYRRTIALSGCQVVSEFGRRETPRAAEALAALLSECLAPLDPDPILPPGRTSHELRAWAAAPPFLDGALEAALARAGVEWSHADDGTGMWRLTDPDALAWVTGDAPRPGETGRAWLERLLPPETLAFWPSDRF